MVMSTLPIIPIYTFFDFLKRIMSFWDIIVYCKYVIMIKCYSLDPVSGIHVPKYTLRTPNF